MGIESLLVMLVIGAIAGWLAGQIVKGYGFGVVGNIVVGVVGAFVAGLVFPGLGWTFGGSPVIGSIIHATLGAVVLLVVIGFFRRAV